MMTFLQHFGLMIAVIAIAKFKPEDKLAIASEGDLKIQNCIKLDLPHK